MPDTARVHRHGAAARRRPALDAWLQSAERLLAEQHRHSVSPSLVPPVTDAPLRRTVPLTTVVAGLPSLLRRLVADPGRWILVLQVGPPEGNHYVQYLVCEDGSLVAEAVSNHYLVGPHRHSELEHSTLRTMGWAPPSPGSGNWRFVQATLDPDLETVAHLGASTLQRVFGAGAADSVTVSLHSSPRRGGTPASATA